MYIDQYTDKVKKHFLDPHNMGKITEEELEDGESLAVGSVGNPACGDLLTIYLKVKDEKIVDCKVETFGCASAIACSSVTTDLVIGKTIDEAKEIHKKDAADALGGLPPIKMHCSNLAADALHKAIENYEKGEKVSQDPENEKPEDKKSDEQKPATSDGPKAEITKDMTLGAVVTKFPPAAQVMMKYGLHCIGCQVATWETVEQGAKAHGMPDEKLDEMLVEMNETIK